MFESQLPSQLNTTPDYVLGVKGGHLVRVPINMDYKGVPVSPAVRCIATGTVYPYTGPQATFADLTLSGTLNVGYGLTADGVTGNITLRPNAATVDIRPYGSGTVVINPATAGSINNMTLGQTTRANAAVATLAVNTGDYTGSGATVSAANYAGKCRIPAGGTTCTITFTNGLSASSSAQVTPLTMDSTATRFQAVVTANTLTITANAAATANTDFYFWAIPA